MVVSSSRAVYTSGNSSSVIILQKLDVRTELVVDCVRAGLGAGPEWTKPLFSRNLAVFVLSKTELGFSLLFLNMSVCTLYCIDG